MIADVKKNSSTAELKKYITYCLSPKKETANEPTAEKTRRKEMRKELKKSDRVTSERVAAFQSDEMEARPSQVDAFVAELDQWTITQKRGRPATAATPRAIMGTFAWDPKDNITPAQAVDLTRESLMKEMGGSYRPGVFVCHQDTDHLHVHFVVAAVGADGLVYDPAGRGQLYRRMEMVMESLETTHGFKRVQQRKAMEASDPKRAVVVAASRGVDLQKAERTGKTTPDMLLQARVINAHNAAKGNLYDFIDALERAGVRWKANVKEDRVAGLSFALASAPEDHGVAAGKLGKAFAWGQLSKTMHYDYAEHFDMLRKHGRKTPPRSSGDGDGDISITPCKKPAPVVQEVPVAPVVPLQDDGEAELVRNLLTCEDITQDDIDLMRRMAAEQGQTLVEHMEKKEEQAPSYDAEYWTGGLVQSTEPQKGPDYTRGLTSNDKKQGDDYGYGY